MESRILDVPVVKKYAPDFLKKLVVNRAHEEAILVNEGFDMGRRVDPLTKLPNREGMISRLGREISRAKRREEPVSVVFIDIDHFKEINDRNGHLKGDELLILFANHVKQEFRRETDWLARFAGDEFVLILPNTDDESFRKDDGLEGKLDALRESWLELVEAEDVKYDAEKQPTLSLGVAIYLPDSPESVEDLIKRADEAMYEAKKSGRNKVVMTEDPKEEG